MTRLLDRLNGVTLSVLVHGLLLLLLGLNLPLWQATPDQPVRLAIDAAVVLDQDAVRERERAEQEARRRETQRQRQAEEARRAADAREQMETRRREQEQARIAAEKQREQERAAEQKRRAEAQRKAEEQKRQAEAARREQERKAAEQKRQQELQARRTAEREAQLKALLAEEEQRDAAVASGLLDQWREVIRQRVQRNWVQPASARPGIECEVRVSQIPGGEVVDVRVGRCNGDAAVVRSIENAVHRSSPLPPPPDASLFERTFTLVFKPEA